MDPTDRPTTSGPRLAALLAVALVSGCGAAGGGVFGPSLSASLPEAPGDHCPVGGQRILTGVDANGNGVLEDAEVQRVAYVCSRQPPATCTTLEGSVVIRNAFDWANLIQAGCTRITGTLEINAPGVTSLGAASPLVQVGQLEVWGSPALTSLRFPALTKVDEGLFVSGVTALTDLQLPSLAEVGTSGLQVSGAPFLTALDLPALTTAAGGVGLYESPRVARVSLPALETVDSISLGGTACTTLRLPALSTAGGLYLYQNPLLAAVDAPALTWIVYLNAVDDPALVRISAPSLTTAINLEFTGLPALGELDLPALTEASENLLLGDVPALTRVALPAVQHVGFFTISGAARLGVLELPSLTSAWYFIVEPSGPGAESIAPSTLTHISLPALVSVTAFSVSGATSLEGLDVPQLTSVDYRLAIRDNPALPQCQADSVLAQLLPPLPTKVTLTGNDAAATCP